MMTDKIFGYEWEDIKHAQMKGGRLPGRAIDLSKPVPTGELTDADRELFAKYGSVEGLEAAGFYGTADRYRRIAK